MRKLDYSKVNANLFVGKTPHGQDYAHLKRLGVKLVINMRVEWPKNLTHTSTLIKEVWVPSIDSRYVPINKAKLLATAQHAASVIRDNGKVYVFCRRGRHRSVVMAATIMLILGASKKDVLTTLKDKRPVFDPRAVDVATTIVT